jgi:hypothetical protein
MPVWIREALQRFPRRSQMTSLSRNARIAGLIYLLLPLFGPIRLIYIPNSLFVTADATATATNIVDHEFLFRFGIVSELFCAAVLIFLVLALFRLFKGVNQTQGVLMVILGGVMPSVINFINAAFDATALLLLRGTDFVSVFEKPQRDALAFLLLRLHHQVDVAAEVLWGLWLFPLAILIWQSRFLPRFLAVWLSLAGLSYLALSFTGELLPEFYDTVFKTGSPLRIGEVVFLLWLLIMGVKAQTSNMQVA